MQTYWLKFTDGTEGFCQGQGAYDAVRIAEHFTGKTVAIEDGLKYRPEESEAIKPIPYPTSKMIWQFDHPIVGKTPGFCFGGRECRGRSSCPQRRACAE